MGILNLSLRNFRCFASAESEFCSGINLIIGENAGGKTSLLEAIFLLGRGRSFRTAHLGAAVQQGASGFELAGKVAGTRIPVQLGLVREGGQLRAKIAGRVPLNLAELAAAFPVQLLDSQAHQLVRGGPRIRRQYLDWGVFHVEPAFYPAWQRYQRALRQRNALLRYGKPNREIASWDYELSAAGEILNRLRHEYLETLLSVATLWSEAALGNSKVSLEYQPGWPEGTSLFYAIQSAFSRDRHAGITQVGPHRADIVIKVAGRIARDVVSRGQEKALAGALLLAQAAAHRILMGLPCTLLLDDLPAELDTDHLARFMGMVVESDVQALISAIDPPPALRRQAGKVFHVKPGQILKMV